MRTKDIIKNIVLSVSTRFATILSSLLLVPLTINYVNPTQYGIWLTLSSVISWVYFFDLGLGNGFRNRFAEARAVGDYRLARQYVSTTYFAIGSVLLIVYIVAMMINCFLDWDVFLKVSETYRDELSRVFLVIMTFTCLNMFANIFGELLNADQKQGWGSVIRGIGQYMALAVIFILTKTTSGSLTNLAIYYAGVPCLVMGATSVLMYRFSRYRRYSPRIGDIRPDLIKNILSLGSKFFLIYMCLIAVFQIVNIVISREIGALGVTQYNIANRYFGIVYMGIGIIMDPFWSAFTDAYVRKDNAWMQTMVKRLNKCYLLCLAGLVLMFFCAPYIYRFWIGDAVEIDYRVSVAMAVLIACQAFGNIHMTLINGIGAVRIQMLVYVAMALLSWPLFSYAARGFGLVGIIAVPAGVYLLQGIVAKIQLNKILDGTASGIWLK